MNAQINNILNQTLNKVAKEKILLEIKDKSLDIFPSLIPFSGNVNIIKDDPKYKCIIEINNLDLETFLSHYNVMNAGEALKKLYKKISMDVYQIDSENSDVDFGVGVTNGKINGDIKINFDNNEITKINENKMNKKTNKKTFTISETKLIDMIQKIVESTPGLDITEKSKKSSKKETDSYLTDVTKKVKDALSFDGNDNPEFPKQIGKGEKKTRKTEPKEQEYIDNFRGETNLDLDYDTPETEEFKERNDMYLKGSTKTGNCQDKEKTVNTTQSDLGEKLEKVATKKKEIKEKKPMYIKDKTPVGDQETEDKMLKEDMDKIRKQMFYKFNS